MFQVSAMLMPFCDSKQSETELFSEIKHENYGINGNEDTHHLYLEKAVNALRSYLVSLVFLKPR